MLDFSYKKIILVALPLMASSLVQSIVMLTDAAFLARWDTLSFDASGNAGLLYVTLFVCLAGLADSSQILQAQKIGDKNFKAVKQILQNTVLINALLGILLTLIAFLWIQDFLFSFTQSKELALLESKFLQIRIWGLPFVAITTAINSYFNAQGKTWKVLISAGVTALFNVWWDYMLIFGNSFFEPMGIEGAALASAISDGVGCVAALTMLYLSRKEYRMFNSNGVKISWNTFREITKIGFPLVFQGLIALSTWTLFFTWIEQRGTYELTVSQNIRAIYFLAFIPIQGFGATTRIYISQYVGAKQFHLIPKIQLRLTILCLLTLLLLLHGAVFYPSQLISSVNPSESYLAESASILTFIFGSILIYGIGTISFQALNGFGKTRLTFVIEIVAVGLYLLSAYLFIKVLNWKIRDIWLVEYIYFIALSGFSFIYLYFFLKNKKA